MKTTPTTHTSRQRSVAKQNTSRSAANVLPAPEPTHEPGTITAPGSTSTHASTLAQHPAHVQNKSNARHGNCSYLHQRGQPRSRLPPTRPPVCCHTDICHHAWSAIANRPKPANDATSGGQTKHSIQSRRAGIISGRCGEAVASRAGQSRSAMEESGRSRVICTGGVSIPAGAQKSVRASRSLRLLAARAPQT